MLKEKRLRVSKKPLRVSKKGTTACLKRLLRAKYSGFGRFTQKLSENGENLRSKIQISIRKVRTKRMSSYRTPFGSAKMQCFNLKLLEYCCRAADWRLKEKQNSAPTEKKTWIFFVSQPYLLQALCLFNCTQCTIDLDASTPELNFNFGVRFSASA